MLVVVLLVLMVMQMLEPQQPDPWFGQTIGQPRAGIIGSAPAAAAAPALGATSGTQYFNTGSPHGHVGSEGEHKRTNDKWKLYDEKFILPPVLATNKYDGRKPLEWLQDIRDYVAGRTEEMDHLLNWIEVQTEPIVVESLGHSAPMVSEAPSLRGGISAVVGAVASTCARYLGSRHFC